MNTKEQIDYLNYTVKCRLAPSKIHGVGVFAIRDIKKGEMMHCSDGPEGLKYNIPYDQLDKLRPEIYDLLMDRWRVLIKEGNPFQSPNDDANMVSFMNNSKDANYRHDVALRDIKKGEEVTENYKDL